MMKVFSPMFFPPDMKPGEAIVFDHPHQATDHRPKPVWEIKPGGAIARCKVCDEPLTVSAIVTGLAPAPEQERWLAPILADERSYH